VTINYRLGALGFRPTVDGPGGAIPKRPIDAIDAGLSRDVDVPLAFGLVGSSGAEEFVGSGPEAEALACSTMGAWLAFARSGDPNHADLPAWGRFDVEGRRTMLIGPRCGMEEDPLGAERSVWDGRID
jgi:para-nitrobenzyl esterase